ncbi:serine/arginine repetitive matrix protein 2 [Streptomyces sp. PT12]|uniref:serine/arginine repetitive matrix protein 2 n=1 Tax=Streptomyces sp. PT12 TaxID=1510197 RepID=UPI000DE36EAE|nr:serine/arginine repetitive matrix protein 2 [Streptomyces sp. PT12]RBM20460.1 serine/arginine repetitive matrix protein 2 [Streptomyces sp. PT12]
MPDFAMDYDKLYAMRRGLHGLAERADSAGGSGAWAEIGEGTATSNQSIFGNYQLSYQFQLFYGKSKTRIDEGKDKLESFGDMFGGVADALLQQDAMIAGQYTTMAGQMIFDDWLAKREAVEDWERGNEAWNNYIEEIGAAEYFEEHPDANIWEVCSAEDAPDWCKTWEDDYGDRPVQPGERPPEPPEHPPSHMKITDGDGSIEFWVRYDEDYNILQEKSTVTTPNGETVTTTVDYDGPPRPSDPDNPDNSVDTRDYTVTTIGPDGSKSTVEVEVSDDGQTRTETSTSWDEDGDEEVEVKEFVRSDEEDEVWREVETEEDD